VHASESSALIDEGGGPPLVVFHGWNGSKHNLLRWLPALTPRFRVIVPDLPGCNGVPPLAREHTADAYAEWAERFIDELGLRSVFVGGLCSGTTIALSLAARNAARVDGMLLHTPFLRPALIRPAVRLQLMLLSSPVGRLFGPLRRSTFLATVHRTLFANAAEVEAPQLAHDQEDLLRADVRAGRDLARDLLRVDFVDVLRASTRRGRPRSRSDPRRTRASSASPAVTAGRRRTSPHSMPRWSGSGRRCSRERGSGARATDERGARARDAGPPHGNAASRHRLVRVRR
jgi:pimeloyl-ACP methyl ester carboxylesterase